MISILVYVFIGIVAIMFIFIMNLIVKKIMIQERKLKEYEKYLIENLGFVPSVVSSNKRKSRKKRSKS